MMVLSARDEILGSIRRATATDGMPPAGEYTVLAREYVRTSTATLAQRLALFTKRLHDYDAQVLQCSQGEVASSIARLLTARAVRRIAVPRGLTYAELPGDFDFLVDDPPLTHRLLDGCEGVLTESTVAIAETGSIVLQNVAGQGRRALSLIPDYHLCLVLAQHVVATVPEAFARLASTSTLPTTFVSGPSATADIEMTRIKGVHGPRSLDVLLVVD